ncbi:acyltransferase family protein [Paenibacillus sp. R14(2021)]|uniref:acyltransferase family protein n=1 Tax=Paenibacillus sp. R14(2021) TaxID=2859228 RepID=UPI001C6149D4|nr:acyltransferase family protein [Paenibacillus sp. R14(2021)]
MPKPLGNSGRYMPGLDGLRAIAVFAVIAYHLNLSWVPGGLLGVGIFFVLSGYLITDILLKQHATAGRLNLGDFWIRRARRLLPAMMIMLTLVSAWLLVTDPARLFAMKGEIVSALLYYSNWRMIFHHVSYFESFGPPSPLGHLWSLAVEEQFYLIWPIVLVFMARKLRQRGRLLLWILGGAAVSAAAMALIYVPGLDPSRVYYGTDTRAFGLLTGAALAVVWPSWKLSSALSHRGRAVLDAVGIAGLLTVAFMIARVGEYDTFLYRGGMVIVSAATAAVVAAMAHPASRLARLIGSKPIRRLGVRSYGIYLYHYPVIALSTPAAQVDEFHPVRAMVQVLVSIMLAELSWRYVEEPIRHGALSKLRSKFAADLRVSPLKHGRGMMIAGICALMIVSVSCSSPNNKVEGDDGHTAAENNQPVNHASDGGSAGLVDTMGHAAESGASDGTAGSGTPADDSKGGGADTTKPGSGSPGGGSGKGPNRGNSGNLKPEVAGDNSSSEAGKPEGGSAAGNSGGHEQQPATTNPKAGSGVTVIGDSVILDAKSFLEKRIKGVVVEGKVGRQMSQADDVIADLKKRRQLGQIVVVELGTNGSFTQKQLNQLLEAIGEDHTIYFVNTRVPRKWQDVVNDMLTDTVANTPNTKLIDWYTASKDHEDFFAKDGVHLKRSGGEFFANLIVDSLKHRSIS